MSVKKHTKIYGKISDLKSSPEFLQSITDEGFNVAWLNSAHQDEEGAEGVIEHAREVSDQISVIIDTKGPEIRISKIEENKPFLIEKGQKIQMTGNLEATGDDVVHVDYPTFAEELVVDQKIYIDDAEIALHIEAIEGDMVHCVVDNGDKIKRNKSVNVPDVGFKNLKPLTEKDKRFIRWAAQNDVDYVIHSFVRGSHDVKMIQDILDEYPETKCGIIAKIENFEGVDSVLNGDLLDVVDGIMVARGDLAIEVPYFTVPVAQKKMIDKSLKAGKLTIVATQALHSMIEEPRATRAEVSDIANAVLDGADCVSLSGETAYGDHPVEAVRVMTEVMVETEKERNNVTQNTTRIDENLPHGKIAHEVMSKVDEIEAFVVPNMNHKTVRALATFHADPYIYCVADHKITMRQAAAHSYGVEGFYVEGSKEEQLVALLNNMTGNEGFTGSSKVALVDADEGEGSYEIDTIDKLISKLS